MLKTFCQRQKLIMTGANYDSRLVRQMSVVDAFWLMRINLHMPINVPYIIPLNWFIYLRGRNLSFKLFVRFSLLFLYRNKILKINHHCKLITFELRSQMISKCKRANKKKYARKEKTLTVTDDHWRNQNLSLYLLPILKVRQE